MEKTLLEIIVNSGYGIEIKSQHIAEIIAQIEAVTGVLVNYKPAIWYYETEDGWDRQRKLKDTYFLWK